MVALFPLGLSLLVTTYAVPAKQDDTSAATTMVIQTQKDIFIAFSLNLFFGGWSFDKASSRLDPAADSPQNAILDGRFIQERRKALSFNGGSEWESNPPSPPKDDDHRF